MDSIDILLMNMMSSNNDNFNDDVASFPPHHNNNNNNSGRGRSHSRNNNNNKQPFTRRRRSTKPHLTSIRPTRLCTTPEPFPLLEVSSDSSSEAPSDEECNDPFLTTTSSSPYHPTSLHYYNNNKTQQLQPRTTNHIALHIYDLIHSNTQMALPWGCICEVGQCFNNVNNALHDLGTGAYHVGVEINGLEYAFGATSVPNRSGIFSCLPKLSPGYQYRSSIDFGHVALRRTKWVRVASSGNFCQVSECVDGRAVVLEMAPEYLGTSYDILRKNCCTFAYDLCVRLGVNTVDIPSWFRNLAETGAYGSDMANSMIVAPLQRVLSHDHHCGDDNSVLDDDRGADDNHEPAFGGFETIIAVRRNVQDVVVVSSGPNYSKSGGGGGSYRRSATAAF